MRRSFFGGLRRRVGLRRRGWGCCRGVGPPATVRGSAGGVEPPAEVWGSAAGWTWCFPPRNDVLPVNRTMKKYKIYVTGNFNFLLADF